MTVSALAMNVACEKSNHQAVPLCPNMCITPMAPSPIPIPYPIIVTTQKLDPGCEDTKIQGKKSMNTKSEAKGEKGNQPGTQKDIVSFTTGGVAWAIMGAPTVMFEGGFVVITLSPGMGNSM
jgi:hypothetical protein